MRKLLSKKANIFGKKIPVFVIALIAVLGVASAALVPYLSNVITGNVVVESPLEFSSVSGTGITCSLAGKNIDCGSLTIHGGESFSVTETAKNKGSISSPEFYTVIEVSNLPDPAGLTLKYSTGSLVDQPPIATYTDANTWITYYYYGYANGNIWPAGYVETGTLTFSTAPNFEPKSYGIKVGTVLRTSVPSGHLSAFPTTPVRP